MDTIKKEGSTVDVDVMPQMETMHVKLRTGDGDHSTVPIRTDASVEERLVAWLNGSYVNDKARESNRVTRFMAGVKAARGRTLLEKVVNYTYGEVIEARQTGWCEETAMNLMQGVCAASRDQVRHTITRRGDLLTGDHVRGDCVTCTEITKIDRERNWVYDTPDDRKAKKAADIPEEAGDLDIWGWKLNVGKARKMLALVVEKAGSIAQSGQNHNSNYWLEQVGSPNRPDDNDFQKAWRDKSQLLGHGRQMVTKTFMTEIQEKLAEWDARPKVTVFGYEFENFAKAEEVLAAMKTAAARGRHVMPDVNQFLTDAGLWRRNYPGMVERGWGDYQTCTWMDELEKQINAIQPQPVQQQEAVVAPDTDTLVKQDVVEKIVREWRRAIDEADGEDECNLITEITRNILHDACGLTWNEAEKLTVNRQRCFNGTITVSFSFHDVTVPDDVDITDRYAMNRWMDEYATEHADMTDNNEVEIDEDYETYECDNC